MWVFCTQMCGFGTVNVLLCGEILVYNEIAINQRPLDITANQMKLGGKKVPKTELEMRAIGKPDIWALSKAEQRIFLETLLARIIELKEKDKQQTQDKK